VSATTSKKPTRGAEPASRFSRRRLLRATLAGGALVVVGTALAYVRTRGYDIPVERERRLALLAPWQLVVVEHVARRIAAPDRPGDRAIPTSDDVDVAGFIDRYAAAMDAPLRRDFLRCLAVVEHVAPFAVGHTSRFTRLDADGQDQVLAWLESNDSPLLRAAFEALKALVFMGYYRDARTWHILGYDGPLVGRPATGWLR
jgi:hypothetical protein